MKRYLVTVLFLLGLLVSPVTAEPIEAPKLNLPDTQAGIAYSLETEELKACATLTLLSYPTKVGEFELRGGYIADKQPMGAICFRLGDLTQFGFKMPLHHLLNVSVGGYLGYMFDEKETDYGIVVTIIEVKF